MITISVNVVDREEYIQHLPLEALAIYEYIIENISYKRLRDKQSEQNYDLIKDSVNYSLAEDTRNFASATYYNLTIMVENEHEKIPYKSYLLLSKENLFKLKRALSLLYKHKLISADTVVYLTKNCDELYDKIKTLL